MSVVLNYWHREFYNALQEKNWPAFLELLFLYRQTPSGCMPGFCEFAAVLIAIAVYSVYLNQWLQIRWRRWMTDTLPRRVAGRPRLLPHQPDHRPRRGRHRQPRPAHRRGPARLHRQHAVARPRTCCPTSSRCPASSASCGACPASVDAVRHQHPRLHGLGRAVYAVVGTWLTHLVGRPLAALNFRQQRVEADFRYALVRVRENMEGIALYRGEHEEQGTAAASVRRGDRQLVRDHAADETAEHAGGRLRPGRR